MSSCCCSADHSGVPVRKPPSFRGVCFRNNRRFATVAFHEFNSEPEHTPEAGHHPDDVAGRVGPLTLAFSLAAWSRKGASPTRKKASWWDKEKRHETRGSDRVGIFGSSSPGSLTTRDRGRCDRQEQGTSSRELRTTAPSGAADATDKEVLESIGIDRGTPCHLLREDLSAYAVDALPEGNEGQGSHRQGAERGLQAHPAQSGRQRGHHSEREIATRWREASFPERAGVSAHFRGLHHR